MFLSSYWISYIIFDNTRRLMDDVIRILFIAPTDDWLPSISGWTAAACRRRVVRRVSSGKHAIISVGQDQFNTVFIIPAAIERTAPVT